MMMGKEGNKTFNIAVGIVRTEDKRIFITQRGEHSHLAGYWEFPGGKIKMGETPESALIRELEEEIDIVARHIQRFDTLTHSYDDRDVVLHFFIVDQWDGEPFAREGQLSRWTPQNELDPDDFPQANRIVIERLLVA